MADELEVLARDEVSAAEARNLIWITLQQEGGQARAAYSALCRWTWRVTMERRLDSELRAWHRLLLDVAGLLALRAENESPCTPPAGLGLLAAAERVRGLADILSLSIDAAEVVDNEEFMSRAHVRTVLNVLAAEPDTSLRREKIRRQTGLGQANLSRLLTLLTVKGLLERKSISKSAEFKITARGLQLCTESKPAPAPAAQPAAQSVLSFRSTPDRRSGEVSVHWFNGRSSGTVHEEVYRRQTGIKEYPELEPLLLVVKKPQEQELPSRIVLEASIALSALRRAEDRREYR